MVASKEHPNWMNNKPLKTAAADCQGKSCTYFNLTSVTDFVADILRLVLRCSMKHLLRAVFQQTSRSSSGTTLSNSVLKICRGLNTVVVIHGLITCSACS